MMYNYNKSDTAYIRSFRLAALMEESSVRLSPWTPLKRQVEGHREQKSLGQVDLCGSSRITAWRDFPPQTCHLTSDWIIILDGGSSSAYTRGEIRAMQ